jgi:hypothetical protein
MTKTQARNLIAASQAHSTTATAPYSDALSDALRALADDYSEPGAGEVRGDYWGDAGPVSEIDGSQDATPWRVELV